MQLKQISEYWHLHWRQTAAAAIALLCAAIWAITEDSAHVAKQAEAAGSEQVQERNIRSLAVRGDITRTCIIGDKFQLSVFAWEEIDGDFKMVDLTNDKGTEYHSMDPIVLKVNKQGEVTCLKPGHGTINITYGTYLTSMYVTVLEKGLRPGWEQLTGIYFKTGIVLKQKSGDFLQLLLVGCYNKISPSGEAKNTERDLTPMTAGTIYRSNNPQTAEVDENGLVTCKKPGRAVIIAENGEHSAKITINVK